LLAKVAAARIQEPGEEAAARLTAVFKAAGQSNKKARRSANLPGFVFSWR